MTEDIHLTKYLRTNKDNTDLKFIKLISASCMGCSGIQKFNTKYNNFLKLKDEYKDFFKRSTFYNLDCEDFLKVIKNKKNILVYFDPPYFNSNNRNYNSSFINKEEYHDGTTFYITILNYFKNSSKPCLFVLNKIDVINYLFKSYLYKEYKGNYQNTMKQKKDIKGIKTKKHHMVYMNNFKI